MYGYVRYEYSTVGTVSRRMTVLYGLLHIALYVRGAIYSAIFTVRVNILLVYGRMTVLYGLLYVYADMYGTSTVLYCGVYSFAARIQYIYTLSYTRTVLSIYSAS